MNNLPTIVKDRIQKPVIAIGILSLVMISFLIHGDWKIAIVLLVFIAATGANMYDFYNQYRKGKILICRGVCENIEIQGNIIRKAMKIPKTNYQIRMTINEAGEYWDEREEKEVLIYLHEMKNLVLHKSETYEFAFRNSGELDNASLVAYKLISNKTKKDEQYGRK